MLDSAWKNIAVFLDETPGSARLGKIAAELARRNEAHLVGIYGLTHAYSEHPAATYARGEGMRTASEHLAAIDQQKVLNAGRNLGILSEKYAIGAEFRVIWTDRAKEEVFLHSLHCDLLMVGHPDTYGLPKDWSSKRMLVTGGAPVLIVPNEWEGRCPGDHVIVAWNASRGARRAITDAMPVIKKAKTVTILLVDADREFAPHGEEPGADIATYLARHGAKVEVARVSSGGQSVAETILGQASKRHADLIVLGAYSHSRSSEIIFGGVTKSFLAKTPFPLLMSR